MAKLSKPSKMQDSAVDGFVTDVYSTLQNGLSIADNFDGKILTVITTGVYPILVAWPNRNKPVVAWIGQCREVEGNHTNITTAPYLDWEMSSDGRFKINNVAGLSASSSNRFQLTIVALAN